jgi:thiamine-monophosphate kinase
MKFSELGEFEFIDRINVQMIHRPEGVVQGIGDDAAVFETRPGWLLVLTTDMLVEGVHFLRAVATPRQLGRKSLVVSLSDIAAMGAEPLDAYVSLAIPLDLEVEYMESVYEGMREVAGAYGVNLLGGDTTRSPGPLVINVALTGTVPRDQPVLRSGAQPGEAIYVTTWLGDAAGGLDLIRTRRSWKDEGKRYLLDAHLDPRPHLEEGRFLAENHFARSMIDLSDGVASDLRHICRRSGVGAVIREALIPISDPLRAYAKAFDLDLPRLALHSGEDYGLLLTVRSDRGSDLEQVYRRHFGRAIWRIGETTADPEIVFVTQDGIRRPLRPEGWDPFRSIEQ